MLAVAKYKYYILEIHTTTTLPCYYYYYYYYYYNNNYCTEPGSKEVFTFSFPLPLLPHLLVVK